MQGLIAKGSGVMLIQKSYVLKSLFNCLINIKRLFLLLVLNKPLICTCSIVNKWFIDSCSSSSFFKRSHTETIKNKNITLSQHFTPPSIFLIQNSKTSCNLILGVVKKGWYCKWVDLAHWGSLTNWQPGLVCKLEKKEKIWYSIRRSRGLTD